MKTKYITCCVGFFFLAAVTLRAQIDLNQDGLSDIWQKYYANSDDPEADKDQDGFDNKAECQAGTNPNDPHSYLRIMSCFIDEETGHPVLCWLAQKGKRYHIEWSSSMEDNSSDWLEQGKYEHRFSTDEIHYIVELDETTGTHDEDLLFLRIRVSDVDKDQDGLTAWEEEIIGTEDADDLEEGEEPEDHEVAEAWLMEEEPLDDYPEGDDESEDVEESSDDMNDLLLELYEYVSEEPEEALSEFPQGSLLGDLVQQLQQLDSEDEVFEFIDHLSEDQRAQIQSEFSELEMTDPDDEHGEGSEEEDTQSELEYLADWFIDLFYYFKEEPNEALEEFPTTTTLGELGRQLQTFENEEQVMNFLHQLDATQLEIIQLELEKLEGKEPEDGEENSEGEGDSEDAEEDAEGDEDPEEGEVPEGDSASPARVEFPGGMAPVTVPTLPTQAQPLVTLAEASRFLTQATLGADYETIESVAHAGFEPWIDYQFSMPKGSHLEAINRLRVYVNEEGEEILESPYRWAWWEQVMKSPDLLRQRVAFALSEIMVVSDITDELEDNQWGIASYYDVLLDGAFGNFRDLLMDVSTHSVMGHWLSHAKNQPTDLSLNRFPDENYAREVMQLFSIGLYELNPDGSKVLNIHGQAIPTYDNGDITELAKVFTGMTFSPNYPNDGTPKHHDEDEEETITNVSEFLAIEPLYLTQPMFMYEPMHEQGSKTVLGKHISGGTIQEDLDAAIDILFYHPNTGPFIAYRLIQRMVTSNPSPEYIARVSAAFGNNGSGVRGDMKAVIRAILMDPEARDLSRMNDPHYGMLREPYVRYTHLCRAFNAKSQTGAYRNMGESSGNALAQLPMHAPSVFNFFLPDYQPLGPIAEAGLVGPEFQITTASTSVSAINFWGESIFHPMDIDEDIVPNEVKLDLSDEVAIAGDVSALIDRLDIILTRGSLSKPARQIIQQNLYQVANQVAAKELVEFAVYLFLNSPDFAVLR